MNLLRATALSKHFTLSGPPWRRPVLRAVDGIGIHIDEGESLALVGESGCGKSTTARMAAGLIKPTSGHIQYAGTDLHTSSRSERAAIRPQIQMIFQDPYSSLNPRHSVSTILEAPMILNRITPPEGRRDHVEHLLAKVGLQAEHQHRYPHEFSGGQRQRIGIARALVTQPKLIIADEAVSALDVSIQAQTINLLRQLQDEFGMAFLFISHDLAVVRHFCHRVAVMYLGKIIETGTRDNLYAQPAHPYTQALLSAVPDPSASRPVIRLSGDVPSPLNPASGCRFRTRCWKARDVCAETEPKLVAFGASHEVACHFPDSAS